MTKHLGLVPMVPVPKVPVPKVPVPKVPIPKALPVLRSPSLKMLRDLARKTHSQRQIYTRSRTPFLIVVYLW